MKVTISIERRTKPPNPPAIGMPHSIRLLSAICLIWAMTMFFGAVTGDMSLAQQLTSGLVHGVLRLLN